MSLPSQRVQARGLFLAGTAEVGHTLVGLYFAYSAAAVRAVLAALSVNLKEVSDLHVYATVHAFPYDFRGFGDD